MPGNWRRRGWREGVWPKGIRHSKTRPGLPARECAGDSETLPRGRERDARGAPEVAGIGVVHDGDGYLLRSRCNLRPNVERVLASGDEAGDLLLDDRRRGHRRGGVRGRVAIRRSESICGGHVGSTVRGLLPYSQYHD